MAFFFHLAYFFSLSWYSNFYHCYWTCYYFKVSQHLGYFLKTVPGWYIHALSGVSFHSSHRLLVLEIRWFIVSFNVLCFSWRPTSNTIALCLEAVVSKCILQFYFIFFFIFIIIVIVWLSQYKMKKSSIKLNWNPRKHDYRQQMSTRKHSHVKGQVFEL